MSSNETNPFGRIEFPTRETLTKEGKRAIADAFGKSAKQLREKLEHFIRHLSPEQLGAKQNGKAWQFQTTAPLSRPKYPIKVSWKTDGSTPPNVTTFTLNGERGTNLIWTSEGIKIQTARTSKTPDTILQRVNKNSINHALEAIRLLRTGDLEIQKKYAEIAEENKAHNTRIERLLDFAKQHKSKTPS